MKKILPIIGDTWRQSRKQVAFTILISLMLIIAICSVALISDVETDEGERAFGFVFSDSAPALDAAWARQYAQAELIRERKAIDMSSEEGLKALEERVEAIQNAEDIAEKTSRYDRSVQYYFYLIGLIVFSVAMWFYIGTSAGYFPDMISEGAVDLIVSKPLSRTKIYLGKYFGGLALFAAALFVTYSIIYLGLGLRTGVWHGRIYAVLPMQIFIAASLFAILALIGVLSRSATLATVLGFILYLVVDTFIKVMIDMQMFGVFKEIGWLDSTVNLISKTIPNFGFMRDVACNYALATPALPPTPFIVAGVWMVLCLLLGLWKFNRADY